MGHRHLPHTFQWLGRDQNLNQNHMISEQSHSHIGREFTQATSSAVYPMENMYMIGVAHPFQWNPESSREMPRFQPAVSGPFYNTFPHSSPSGNFYVPSEINPPHVHTSYYNRHSVHGYDNSIRDSSSGTKRKATERSSTSRYYSTGSSSNSSEIQTEQPNWNPISLPHYRGFSVASEDPLRNVRRRSGVDVGPNYVNTNISSYSSRHYYSSSNSVNYTGTAGPTNHSVNYPVSASLFERISTSGESSAEIGGYHHNSVPIRHHVSPPQYLNGPPPQAERGGHSGYSRRVPPPYRPGFGYLHSVNEAPSSESGILSVPEAYYARNSRPSPAVGWHQSHRNVRPRIAVDRFESSPNAVAHARDRMGSQSLRILDYPPLYSSVNMFDEYEDMRLDTDNMSYEELLALGESIGNVNTGLSEDVIAKCLMKTASSSADQNEEGTCTICLEIYGKNEDVGKVKECGHEFHIDCIKKWLSVKNICPICKSPANSHM